ncbi:MAG: oligosaccharide flippase family protein, partial [Deltaproteobacteria bacterium]|nr:oligosaccharide flippase family protein [Deltaproteobacteria bacterium]
MERHRGTAALLAAKIIFLGAGYVLYLALARLLTIEDFGVYGVVFGVVILLNLVLFNGTMQSVSHYVAANPGAERAVLRRSYLDVSLLVWPVVIGFWFVAPLLAEFFHDPRMTHLFRLACLILAFNAYYAVNVGYLNGRHWFDRQAMLDVAYMVLKVALMVGLVAAGLGLTGAVIGFAAATFGMMAISITWNSRDAPDAEAHAVSIPVWEFMRFGVTVMVVALVLNAIMAADLFWIKRLSPGATGDAQAGYYTAAQTIARIPFWLMTVASLIMFPALARLKGEGEEKARARGDQTSRAMAAAVGLVLGMGAVSIPVADRLLKLLYPDHFVVATSALVWLIVAMCVLTLANLGLTMISGAGRPFVAARILAVALAVQTVLALLFIKPFGLVGAAMSTTVASVFALGACAAWLRRHFDVHVPLRFPVMAAVGSLIAGASVAWWNYNAGDGRLWRLPFVLVTYYGAYLLILAMGGTLTGAGSGRGPKRVLLFSKGLDFSSNDGARNFVRSMVRYLNPHDVAIVLTRPPAEVTWLPKAMETNLVFPDLGSALGKRLQDFHLFLFLLVNRFRYRALHMVTTADHRATRTIRFLRRITPGVPILQSVIDGPGDYAELRRYLATDMVTTGSHTIAGDAAKDRRQVHLLPQAIEVETIREDRRRVIDELGLDERRFHILIAGDLPERGVLRSLERVVPELLVRSKRLHLHLAVADLNFEGQERVEEFYRVCMAPYVERASLHRAPVRFESLLAMHDAMLYIRDDKAGPT